MASVNHVFLTEEQVVLFLRRHSSQKVQRISELTKRMPVSGCAVHVSMTGNRMLAGLPGALIAVTENFSDYSRFGILKTTRKRLAASVLVSWIIGIASLFFALQFSPPRWSIAAMGGALRTAAESSFLYVLPPLLILALWQLRKGTLSGQVACLVAVVWIMLTVAWWASSFSPVPWLGALRNLVILLPSALVPSIVFYLLVRQR